MSDQPPKQALLSPELHERTLNPDRLALDQEGPELIRADDIERGLQLANVIWFIVNSDRRVGER